MAAYTFEKKRINDEALKQNTTWFDRRGREYKITEMSPFHAKGALTKLFEVFGVGAVTSPLWHALVKQAGG